MYKMSINQIQENTRFPGWRDWLNARVDDLKIYSQLNIEMDLATVGDVFELGAGLIPTWVPGGAAGLTTMDHMMAPGTAYTFNANANVPVPFNNTPLVSSPHISVINNGEVLITKAGIYMIMVLLNITITNTTQNPAINLQRYDSATAQFIDDGESLGTSIIIQPNYPQGKQSLTAMHPVLIAEDHPSNNKFRIMGSNPGVNAAVLDPAESSITVIKLS